MTNNYGSRVFIDTSAYYALTDKNDDDNKRAVEIARRLGSSPVRLFTTNYIVVELHALVLSRFNSARALQVINDVERSIVNIVRADLVDEQRAKEILARYSNKDFSFTDTISFAVMDRLSIDAAFAFDHHFKQYGFVLLEDIM